MPRTIRRALCAFATLLVASPSFADDTGFELIAIGERSSNESDFVGLSFRVPLIVSAGGAERTAFEGPRLRFDVARSTYETGFDGLPGEATTTTSRLMLSYGFALSETATLTLAGGVSNRVTEVRPATTSAPAGLDRIGAFLAAELEAVLYGTGDLQLLLEHDGTSGDFGAITYLHGTGGLRVGPTISHYSEDNYELSRAGIVAAFDIAEDAELRLTATRGWSSSSGTSAGEVSSVQVQLRLAF